VVAERDEIPVVSYARISADIERDEHGVQTQHSINRATAERYGWTVVHEFTDNDKSAAKRNVVRDEFEAMVRALRSGKLPNGTPVRGVVVVADDRLARRPGDYERFVEAITYRDGRVFSDQRGPKDLYSEDVESIGLIGAVISKAEVRKMQRRMRNDHRRRALAGEPPAGGNRPFGWNEDRRALHPVEAPLVRKAAQEFAAGRSLNSIVGQWIREGRKTTTGWTWTTTSLKVMLKNPRLCGWRMINNELIRDAAGEPVVGKWEAIITPEQWMALNAIFTARKGRTVAPAIPRQPTSFPDDPILEGSLSGRSGAAQKNSMGPVFRSVQRRSLPKLFIQEFVRSTTHLPSAWIGVCSPRLAIVAGVQAEARVRGQGADGRLQTGTRLLMITRRRELHDHRIRARLAAQPRHHRLPAIIFPEPAHRGFFMIAHGFCAGLTPARQSERFKS
jgi:DNA invertase Pin-like site-specific DNA recombinase